MLIEMRYSRVLECGRRTCCHPKHGKHTTKLAKQANTHRIIPWPDLYSRKKWTSEYTDAANEPFNHRRRCPISSAADSINIPCQIEYPKKAQKSRTKYAPGTSVSALLGFTYVNVQRSPAFATSSKQRIRSSAKNMFFVKIFIP